MSLRSIGKTKDTTTIALRAPDPKDKLLNEDGSPMTVTLYGPYSPQYRQAQRAMQREAVETGAASATMSEDELDARVEALLIASIKEWAITLDPEDGLLPLNEANARALFTEFPWLRDQLLIAQGTVANFLDRPAAL
jgi:hypothetical protein